MYVLQHKYYIINKYNTYNSIYRHPERRLPAGSLRSPARAAGATTTCAISHCSTNSILLLYNLENV